MNLNINLKDYFQPIQLSFIEKTKKFTFGVSLSLNEFKELSQDDKILYIQGKASKNQISNDILKIFIDVSNGLKFLHDNNLVHLDIKPTNILVDKDTYKAYLIDYGLSCVYNNINKFNCNNQNFVGVTYKYFPAEVINLSENKKYGIGPYTDIYSLGITFKEMLLKNNIKPSKQLKELLNDMTSFNDITDRPDIVCVINELTKMLK